LEEGEVVVGFAVAAGGDSAHRFEPGVRAFYRPAVTRARIVDLESSFLAAPDLAHDRTGRDRVAGAPGLADPRLDPALGERDLVCLRGITAVGPQLAWVHAGFRDRIQQRQQVGPLVLVSGPEQDVERQPVRLDYEMEAAAGRPPDRAGDLFAPFFASTSDASTITRDQSSLSAPTSPSCR
jgi:hypothetical protein